MDIQTKMGACKLDLTGMLKLILTVTSEPEDWQYFGLQAFQFCSMSYATDMEQQMSIDRLLLTQLLLDQSADPDLVAASDREPPGPLLAPHIQLLGKVLLHFVGHR